MPAPSVVSRRSMGELMLKVKETFFVGNTCYRAGFEVADSDPVVKGRELLFVGVVVKSAAPVVESASAAPGATRAVKRPAAKPTKPAAKPTKPVAARK